MNFLHNLSFYINLIKGLDRSLNFSVFPAYINTYSLEGALTFENIAVPHLHLYIPAIIYNLTENINLSINMYLIFIDILMFINMYIALSTISKKKWGSLVFSLLYVGIYLITMNNLVIADLGVSFAIAILPLFIASLYNIYKGSSKYSILFILSLFLIAESSVTIFLLSICIIILFTLLHIADAIFKLKFFHIIGLLIVTLLLLSYTYVPMVDYYLDRQLNIISIIGDNSTIIKTSIYVLIIILYILLSSLFISKANKSSVKTASSIIIILFAIISIFSYFYIYKYTDRLNIKDDIYSNNMYIVSPNKSFDIEDDYDIYGYKSDDIIIENYDTGYIQMDISYKTSEKYNEYMIDTPYSYIKGLKASDIRGNEYNTSKQEDGLMRVYVKKGDGLIHISYKNPVLYDIAFIVSIITLLTYLGFKSISEIKDMKGAYIMEKAKMDILTKE